MNKVLGVPAFRRLLTVTTIAEIALSSGIVALALLVYRRTGSAVGATAFFLCAQFGPALISPLFVARFDQRAARKILALLYSTEGFVFALLAWLVGHFALTVLLLLALVDGTLAITARVLVRTAWTSVTNAAGLMRDANALINTAFSVAFMIGPAIGGALVATGGTKAALLVNVALYALSTVTVATSKTFPNPTGERVSVTGRVRAALRYARSEPLIRTLLSIEATAILFFTISVPVEVVLAQHTLHAGPGGYGALLTVWGAGTIVGSAIYARWRRLSSRFLITIGTVLLGLGFVVMAVAPSLFVALVGAAIGGTGNGSQVVAVRTALQEAVHERWMALILSLNESIFLAVPGLGIVLGGAITALAGPRVALGTAAAGSLAVASAMWLTLDSRRSAQDEHVAPPTPTGPVG